MGQHQHVDLLQRLVDGEGWRLTVLTLLLTGGHGQVRSGQVRSSAQARSRHGRSAKPGGCTHQLAGEVKGWWSTHEGAHDVRIYVRDAASEGCHRLKPTVYRGEAEAPCQLNIQL